MSATDINGRQWHMRIEESESREADAFLTLWQIVIILTGTQDAPPDDPDELFRHALDAARNSRSQSKDHHA